MCDSWRLHQTGLFSSAAVESQSKFTEFCSSATFVPQSKSTEVCSSAAAVPQSKSTEYSSSAAVVAVVHKLNLPSCVARRPLCHKVNLPRWEARQRHFIMTSDIYGTGQTNSLAPYSEKLINQPTVAPLKSLQFISKMVTIFC